MAPYQFWAFITVTTLRHIPHLYLDWQGRQLRKSHHSGQFITLGMYVLYVGVWLSSIVASYHQMYAGAAYVLGGAVLLSGIALRLAGLWSLRKYFNSMITIYQSHCLVTTGLYRVVRHPLHLALLVELIGMMVYSGAWRFAILWIFWAVLLVLILVRNRQEDTVLREKFGSSAILYQNCVPSMNVIAGIWRYFQADPHER